MPINKFYVNFAIRFGPFKPTKGIKRNQKYAHRFPQLNFEILTNVTPGFLGPTLPILPWNSAFQEDQHEGGPSYGMMPTHTQPAVRVLASLRNH